MGGASEFVPPPRPQRNTHSNAHSTPYPLPGYLSTTCSSTLLHLIPAVTPQSPKPLLASDEANRLRVAWEQFARR